MAEGKDSFNYRTESSRLKKEGPGRLYLLYGEEEYLKEVFQKEIRAAVFPEDAPNDFCYRKFTDMDFDCDSFDEAVNSLPFLADRILIEVNNCDLNRYGDDLLPVVKELPDYCTVVFRQNSEYVLDFRLRFNKYLRENYTVFQFAVQPQNVLNTWIRKRFRAEGKEIGDPAIERLLFLSGSSMNGLIPEIRKIATSAKGETVSTEDVDRMAHHLPEADVFEMVEYIAGGQFESAFALLSELLYSRDNDPIYLLSLLGSQFKRLYAASVSREERKGESFLLNTGVVKYDWLARKLYRATSRFSIPGLEQILSECADADYRMKSSFGDNAEILEDLLIRISAEA